MFVVSVFFLSICLWSEIVSYSEAAIHILFVAELLLIMLYSGKSINKANRIAKKYIESGVKIPRFCENAFIFYPRVISAIIFMHSFIFIISVLELMVERLSQTNLSSLVQNSHGFSKWYVLMLTAFFVSVAVLRSFEKTYEYMLLMIGADLTKQCEDQEREIRTFLGSKEGMCSMEEMCCFWNDAEDYKENA